MPDLPSRDDALALMHEHVESESLRRHMYAVEAACRAYARTFGADEDTFGLAGLLHDFDYERWPDEHPLRGAEMLRERGYPEPVVRAILAHYSARTGVVPESRLERTLHACDEITGLITAAARGRADQRGAVSTSSSSVRCTSRSRRSSAGSWAWRRAPARSRAARARPLPRTR